MKFLENLAVKLGVTRAEMTAVTLLALFLLLGGALKYSGAVQEADKAIKKAEAARYSEAEVDSLLNLAMKADEPAPGTAATNAATDTDTAQPARITTTASTPKKKFTGTIAFNSASLLQLQKIPGVGPVMAKRLIEFRQQKGGNVKRFNDLLEVKGIGKKKLELLEKHLTLD
ncbi:MAG: helix-hairpin-helix domain-containing protein [Chlorobiaceae bacterium]|nr:helix-hairpin-helix domain-containing protein [Chlorobiaceae bacterium]